MGRQEYYIKEGLNSERGRCISTLEMKRTTEYSHELE